MMKNKITRNIFIIFLTFILIFSLTACKNDMQISQNIKNSNIGYYGYIMFKYIGNSNEDNKVPIKNAKVMLVTETNNITTYTDSKGYFFFNSNELQDREYTLKVFTDYFAEFREDVYPLKDNNEYKTIYIEDSTTEFDDSAIIGKILINDKPAAYIPVRLGLNYTETNKDGFFVFKNLVKGTYYITTDKSDFINVSKKFTISNTNINVNNTIELYKQELNIEGKVLDASTKDSIENVKVEASINSDYFNYNKTTYTNTNGEFSFNGLTEGEYIFTFTNAGYYTESRKIDISDDNQRNQLSGVELSKGESNLIVSLKDSASGKPITNIKLEIDKNETYYYSDISGRITVYGLTKANHFLKFTSDFYNTLDKSINITEDIFEDDYQMVSKVNSAKIYGNVFTLDSSEVTALDIGNDFSELTNFNLYINSGGEKRVAPYNAVRGQSSNAYSFNNLPSGIYILEPELVVNEDMEISGKRSSGIYEFEPIDIKINTGEELRFDLLLKKVD